jgi:hypothetical protein
MIYVVDNGGDYSDHGLYWHELPDAVHVDEAIWLLEHMPDSPDHTVVMVSRECTFRGIEPVQGLDCWYALWRWDRKGEFMQRCPVELLRAEIEFSIESAERFLAAFPEDDGRRPIGEVRARERTVAEMATLHDLQNWVEAGRP